MLRRTTENLPSILAVSDEDGGSNGSDLFAFGGTSERAGFEVYRSDKAVMSDYPSAVAMEQEKLEDFFASIATYYQDHSPITALVHVLGGDIERLIAQKSKVPAYKGGSSSPLQTAGIGLAVGEATLAAFSSKDHEPSVVYSACRRSLAFALSRATMLFGTKASPSVLANRWSKLRSLTGLPVSGLQVDVLRSIYELMLRGDGAPQDNFLNSDLAVDVCNLIAQSKSSTESVGKILIRQYPGMVSFIKGLDGPFDHRIGVFTKFLESVNVANQNVRSNEIVVAYACNLLLPGSFAHTNLLLRHLQDFPAAMLWYGMFCSLSRFSNSKVVTAGLVAKLERDLLEAFSFESRPKCDISFDELEVLSRVSLNANVLKPSQQRALLVSIYPGVDVYARFATEGEANIARSRKDSEIEEMHRRVSRLLDEASHIMRRSVDMERLTSSRKSF